MNSLVCGQGMGDFNAHISKWPPGFLTKYKTINSAEVLFPQNNMAITHHAESTHEMTLV